MNPIVAAADSSAAGTRHPRPTVGIRELKQNASRVVADLEADQEIRVVTVNGRAVAGLVPVRILEREVDAARVERIGVRAGDFRARLRSFPAGDFDADDRAAWAADIDGASEPERPVDPWEAAGL